MNQFNTAQEANTAIELALGRILRMGSRPTEPGDLQEYERCKWIILDAGEYLGIRNTPDYEPCYPRDRNKGI